MESCKNPSFPGRRNPAWSYDQSRDRPPGNVHPVNPERKSSSTISTARLRMALRRFPQRNEGVRFDIAAGAGRKIVIAENRKRNAKIAETPAEEGVQPESIVIQEEGVFFDAP